MAGTYTETGEEEVDVSRTVCSTELISLFVVVFFEFFAVVRVCNGDHLAGFSGPAERHTDKCGTVPVSPADVGWCFLVRHKAQVGGRNCVSKSSD